MDNPEVAKENLEELQPSQAETETSSPEAEQINNNVQGQVESVMGDVPEDAQQAESTDEAGGQTEQEPEKAKEKLIPEISAQEYFEKHIKPEMESLLEELGFEQLFIQCQNKLGQAPKDNLKARVKVEKEVVRDLSEAISATEFKKWAFTPASMVDMKACNCSGAALIFAYIMNEKLNIETKQTNPSGHAANVVYYSDKSTEYVDTRNKQFYKINLKPENLEENVEGYDVYKVKKWGLEFTKLPIIDYEEGAANTLLSNTVSMNEDKEKDPEAKEALEKYSDSEKLAFAQYFSSSKFLDTRDKNESWIAEKKRVKRIRILQKIPLIGRLF